MYKKRYLVMLVYSLLVLWPAFAVIAAPSVKGTQELKIHYRTPSGATIPLYDDYHALVVGVGNYDHWQNLRYPTQDAREVQHTLKELGFSVRLLLDPTATELRRALTHLTYTIGSRKDRAILLFFTGHGETETLVTGEKLGYIIPRDTPRLNQDRDGFIEKAISMKQIETYALRMNARHVLMVFDSCFAGSVFTAMKSTPTVISEKSRQPVRQFITAGDENEQVPDASVFKTVFIQGVKGGADLNNDRYITGSELGLYLEDRVTNYSQGRQHPEYGKIRHPKLDKGDFIFALKSLPPQPDPIPTLEPEPLSPLPMPPQAAPVVKHPPSLHDKTYWRERLAFMEKEYAESLKLDEKRGLTAAQRVRIWDAFLLLFAEDNPHSTLDDVLRQEAIERRARHGRISATPKPDPGLLRNRPLKLTREDVRRMIREHNFFDPALNRRGDFPNDYIRNGNGTITDRRSRLQWQHSGSKKLLSYQQAQRYIRKLNRRQFAGHRDWRLPTLEELATLVENQRSNRRLFIDARFSSIQKWCWSADTGLYDSAWHVYFFSGMLRASPKDSFNYVRAVRSLR